MRQYILIIILIFSSKALLSQISYSDNSVLKEGKWIKVSAQTDGIHAVTYAQLQSWGIASPENVAIYSNGGYMLPEMNSEYYPGDLQKIAVFHAKDAQGRNAVFFYSTGTVKWSFNEKRSIFTHQINNYSNKTFFYITADLPKSPAPSNKMNANVETTLVLDYFDELKYYEHQNLNIHRSGNIWYSDRIMRSASKTVSFSFPNVISTRKATMTISGAAASSQESYHHILLNGNAFNTIYLGQVELDYTQPTFADYSFSPSNELNFKITYETDASSGDSWLDYIAVNVQSKLKLTDSQLTFRNKVAKNYDLIGYEIEAPSQNMVLWDVSNFHLPSKVEYRYQNGIVSFTDKGQEINTYVAFIPDQGTFPEPEFVEEVKNQNIHGLPQFEMIIVSHPDFISAAETLAEFHRQNEKLKVLVLDINQVYNEFSSGLPDKTAIKNMLRMFYNRGKNTATAPKYLLLMGDGSYDNLNLYGTKSNFIPTYQSAFIGSGLTDTYVSDDYFGLLDDDEGGLRGNLDIGIGRIPCQTLNEAMIVVNKSINYSKPETMGEWRNVVAMLADDEDGNQWMGQTEEMTNIINENSPGFYFEKIYFDAYRQTSSSSGDSYPDATSAIANRINKGALIVNYIGHANETALASEKVVDISNISSWGNKNKLPIFVTATCEFSRYDDDKMSAGESALFHQAGGGVALFSTTRKVWSGSNKDLNKSFYNFVFQHDEQGKNLRMGDIIRYAKNAMSINDYNKRSFALLGDPALRLAFPHYSVSTTRINGKSLEDSVRIGALGNVTIEGEVLDNNNDRVPKLTGKVYVTVFDKETDAQTLGNDGGRKFNFKVQNNVIYKGTSTVSDGKFSFSFIVPKDITYNLGNGRILYYFSNDTIDGNGSNDQFLIGGSDDNPVTDNAPPQIDIYLNNHDFKSNDKVSSSALLLINLFDESGINTVGTGIGHDLIAILDDDYLNTIVLNDFYTADLNTYKSGKVVFPLNNLSPGLHKLMVRAWDVNNNSSYNEIQFYVEEGFEIISINNAPNPVDWQTTFNITHNLPGDNFNVKLEIFNIRGFLVHEATEMLSSNESTTVSMRWDVADIKYNTVNDRILIYRVTMTNLDGLNATGNGKLLLNKF